MNYQIKYFASFREKAGKSDESLSGEFSSLEEIYDELDRKYAFDMNKENVRASINGEYQDFKTSPKDNDLIVFIPPVAGG